MDETGDATDADLVERSQYETRAFAGLFDRHFEAVHAFCARRAGQSPAEDLAAEAFRRAFEHRHRYDVTIPDARPWLYGIALNLIRGHHRSEGRKAAATARAADSARTDAVVADPATSVASALDAREEMARVRRVLDGLPEADAEALLLHVWEGLSYHEVARALDVPVGTVRSRIHRVRRHLRSMLDRGALAANGPAGRRSS